MYVIPLYPQPVFHSNPNIHSSFLCGFLVPSPPSPPDSLTLQSPDTLDRVFPKAQGQAVLPCRHHMAPEQLGSAPPGPRPLVFRRSRSLTLSDTDVFCWYICVFSSNRTNPPSSSLSGNALLDQIYSAALFFFFFFFLFSFTVSSAVEIPPEHGACISRGNSRVNSGFQLGLLFLRARGLNTVWGDMLLKCKFSRSCRLGSEFDWKQRSWTPRCYLEVEI